jgi:hypothetical protein
VRTFATRIMPRFRHRVASPASVSSAAAGK